MNKMETKKLKERNVKAYLSLLFVLVSLNIYSQFQLSGTYCLEYGLKDFKTCLKFDQAGVFEYEHTGHLGVEKYGKGEYKMNERTLELVYNRTEPKEAPYHKHTYWENKNDSIHFNFKIMNFSDELLPNATVIIDLDKKIGVRTDSSGMACVKLKKSKKLNEIVVNHLGFETYRFDLRKNHNYNIEVRLVETSGIPIKNEIVDFEIIENGSDYFKMKNENGKVVLWKKQK